MLHLVSDCVQLCQFEGSVTTTVTDGVPSDCCAHIGWVREAVRGGIRCPTSFMYVMVLVNVNWRCHQRQLFIYLTNCSISGVNG